MQEQNSYPINIKPAAIIRERDRDLGFGDKVARESRERLMNPDGSFNVERTGFSYLSSLNFYHSALTISWFRFLGIVLLLAFCLCKTV